MLFQKLISKEPADNLQHNITMRAQLPLFAELTTMKLVIKTIVLVDVTYILVGSYTNFNHHQIYASKSNESECSIAELSASEVVDLQITSPCVSVGVLPSFLKVHHSVLELLLRGDNSTASAANLPPLEAEASQLWFEFSPMALHRESSR